MSADWVDHRDVAAYALGLLGPRATADFEAHLSGCELCVAELAEFSRLAAVLPDVDVEALRTDAAGPDSRQLDRLLTRVAYTRRRAASVRLYAAAAAIVLFAGGLAGGLVIGSGHGSGSGTAPPRALPTVAGTSASGAPTVPAIRATDPLSRVQATLLLEPRRWGTQVTLTLANVHGPLECRLIAVSHTDHRDIAMAWTVPPEGYGTGAHPQPLTLQGSTAVQRTDIDHFEVRTVDAAIPSGGTTLVVLPMA